MAGLKMILIWLSTILTTGLCSDIPEKPNIIMILADDMGFGDLASWGHPTQERNPIDTLAAKSLRFNQAYSADSVCSPSRASFMTGRLPVRTGAWGEVGRVWLPWATTGLPYSEITIAEALKTQGYTTGMVGKWHLGINKDVANDGYYLPGKQGFDYAGTFVPFGGTYGCEETGRYGTQAPLLCALMKNTSIIQQPYHHENLTVNFVADILSFIRTNKKGPFFFYYAAMHPHVPMYASTAFKGKSRRGPFGDAVNELGWAVDSIVNELKKQGIAKKTLIVFTSDHGPQLEYCSEGGDPGIFRGSKSNSFEGGYRVPFFAHWPGVIEAGTTDDIISSLDLFPIFVSLAGGTLATDREYDGVNTAEVLLGKSTAQRNFILYYNRNILFAVRYGHYKLHFRTQDELSTQQFGLTCVAPGYTLEHYFYCNEKELTFDCVKAHDPPLLFDLYHDPTESWPLDTTLYPTVLADVQTLIDDHEAKLVRAEPLMDLTDMAVAPCCDASTGCICGFP